MLGIGVLSKGKPVLASGIKCRENSLQASDITTIRRDLTLIIDLSTILKAGITFNPVVAISNLDFSWQADTPPILKIAGINLQASGAIQMLQQSLANMNGSNRDRFPIDHVGVIFQ